MEGEEWSMKPSFDVYTVSNTLPLQVACGVTEWLRAYRILARQHIPKPPLLTAFKVHAHSATAGTFALALDHDYTLVTSIGKK